MASYNPATLNPSIDGESYLTVSDLSYKPGFGLKVRDGISSITIGQPGGGTASFDVSDQTGWTVRRETNSVILERNSQESYQDANQVLDAIIAITNDPSELGTSDSVAINSHYQPYTASISSRTISVMGVSVDGEDVVVCAAHDGVNSSIYKLIDNVWVEQHAVDGQIITALGYPVDNETYYYYCNNSGTGELHRIDSNGTNNNITTGLNVTEGDADVYFLNNTADGSCIAALSDSSACQFVYMAFATTTFIDLTYGTFGRLGPPVTSPDTTQWACMCNDGATIVTRVRTGGTFNLASLTSYTPTGATGSNNLSAVMGGTTGNATDLYYHVNADGAIMYLTETAMEAASDNWAEDFSLSGVTDGVVYPISVGTTRASVTFYAVTTVSTNTVVSYILNGAEDHQVNFFSNISTFSTANGTENRCLYANGGLGAIVGGSASMTRALGYFPLGSIPGQMIPFVNDTPQLEIDSLESKPLSNFQVLEDNVRVFRITQFNGTSTFVMDETHEGWIVSQGSRMTLERTSADTYVPASEVIQSVGMRANTNLEVPSGISVETAWDGMAMFELGDATHHVEQVCVSNDTTNTVFAAVYNTVDETTDVHAYVDGVWILMDGGSDLTGRPLAIAAPLENSYYIILEQASSVVKCYARVPAQTALQDFTDIVKDGSDGFVYQYSMVALNNGMVIIGAFSTSAASNYCVAQRVQWDGSFTQVQFAFGGTTVTSMGTMQISPDRTYLYWLLNDGAVVYRMAMGLVAATDEFKEANTEHNAAADITVGRGNVVSAPFEQTDLYNNYIYSITADGTGLRRLNINDSLIAVVPPDWETIGTVDGAEVLDLIGPINNQFGSFVAINSIGQVRNCTLTGSTITVAAFEATPVLNGTPGLSVGPGNKVLVWAEENVGFYGGNTELTMEVINSAPSVVSPGSGGLSPGAVAGITIAVLAGVTAIAVLVWFFFFK